MCLQISTIMSYYILCPIDKCGIMKDDVDLLCQSSCQIHTINKEYSLKKYILSKVCFNITSILFYVYTCFLLGGSLSAPMVPWYSTLRYPGNDIIFPPSSTRYTTLVESHV